MSPLLYVSIDGVSLPYYIRYIGYKWGISMLKDIQEVFDIVTYNVNSNTDEIEKIKSRKDLADEEREALIAAFTEKIINALEVGYDLAASALGKEETHEDGITVAKYVRDRIERIIVDDIEDEVMRVREVWRTMDYLRDNVQVTPETDLYLRILLLLARNRDFDSYLLYLEKNRIQKERFYLPKRKHFLKIGIIQALQDMIDDKLDILTISMPPSTQKTTAEKFFNSAVIGWFPDDFNLFFSHSGDICAMYYMSVLDICTNTQEYTWQEIFAGLSVTKTNAKMGQFNVGTKFKPFPSLQTASVGSENAGKVRASKFLLIDDMIGKLEEALNKNMLDKLWNVYSVDARQRKLDGCKEIHIATRWSVHDVIGRLQRLYDGNTETRTKFIAVPDIDPETGESNFDYEYLGLSVKFFNDQALAMDDISYRCLYKNEPIEREGLLYHDEDLRRYLSLPEKQPDAILAICDVKNKGTDFMFQPIFYQYGVDFYLVDCVCDDDGDYDRQYEKLSRLLYEHKVQACEYESNTGGDRVAHNVQEKLKEMGSTCTITTKPTETNKETRIISNNDWVKNRIVFRDKSLYSPKSDYGIMMSWLLCYSVVGKNNHDDVPDGLANFRLYVDGMQPKLATIEAVFNPFRSRGVYAI